MSDWGRALCHETVVGEEPACWSSMHERLFHGWDQRQWRELDAGVFKRYLPEAAVADGTLPQLLPPMSELKAS